jgi:hypothetical protein
MDLRSVATIELGLRNGEKRGGENDNGGPWSLVANRIVAYAYFGGERE